MGNAANSRRTQYDVSWNSYDLGFLDDVKPELALKLDPIKIGSLGDVKLGDRILGLEDGAKVTVILRETIRASFQKMAPWASQTAGVALDLTPPAGGDLYTYAQILLLHPRDQVAPITPTTSQDISLTKTVPLKAFELPRTGNDEDKWAVEFLVYPDRTQLPLIKYGTMTA
jgi:hypothetical protein